MPSTYSSNLKIELIAAGEQDTTWGSTTNNNFEFALEQAITGVGTVTFASADVTLGFASSNAAQDFRNMKLVLTGTTGGARNLIVPNIEKLYFIDNTTADTVTVKTSAGTGVAVPSGAKSIVYADAVNVVDGVTHLNSPSFSGTPTAPTAAVNTNTTQLATTAFVVAEIADQNLGTIATQDANNVAITGGSISGITDLAVADGGTGAGDASGARTNLGLEIGTDIPSPTGTGASGTWGIDITGTAALGVLKLISKVAVVNGSTSTGTITSTVSSATFGGITPAYVMYFASAYQDGITDLRLYAVCSGSSFVSTDLVLGGGSDDTDQGSTADVSTTAMFVLPYSASQQFHVTFSRGSGSVPPLYIWAIGYQT